MMTYHIIVAFFLFCMMATAKPATLLVKALPATINSMKADLRVIDTYPEIGYSKIETDKPTELMAMGFYVEPDQRLYALSDNQWSLQPVEFYGVGAEEAWKYSYGEDVVVAVLDTGVDTYHPALKEALWVNEGEIPGNDKDDDGNGFIDDVNGVDFSGTMGLWGLGPYDDNGHGTHVAGIIAAKGQVFGLAPKSKIMALKFLTASGYGDLSHAVKGVLYAANNGATVLNASFGGGGYSQAMVDAIKYAAKKGMIFVAAAGNESSNNDTRPAYPASYKLDSIISVASHDKNERRSYFSNYGKSVHVSAPGSDIYSTWNWSGYKSISGTSMAAPHVAAVVALIQSLYPGESYREVVERVIGKDEGSRYIDGIKQLDAGEALK